jgi:predicted phage tail protein
VPESNETRLARLEGSRDEMREQIKVVVPLVTQYAVLEERMSGFRDDLNEGLESIRAELKDMKQETVGRSKERRAMYAGFALAVFGLLANLLLQLLGTGGPHS